MSFCSPSLFSRLVSRFAILFSLIACAALAPQLQAQTAHPGAQITLGSGFVLPFGVAVDAYGNLFVADQGLGAVEEIVAAGGYTTINTIAGGFDQPVAVAIDGAGNLFIADQLQGTVKQIMAAGGYTTVKTLIGGLNGPTGVAVDGNGNVFIAETYAHAARELLAVNGSIPPSPTVVTLDSGFQIYDVAVDTSGNVFESVVADADSEIRELVAVNGSIPPSPVINIVGNGFDNPYGLSIDGNGNIFVADTYNHAIKEILALGGYTTVETLGSGFYYPSDAVADAKGNVYVADRNNGRVEEILADGRDFGSVNVGSPSATPITLYFTFDTGGTLGSTAVLTQGAVGLDFTDAGTGTCTAGAGYNAGDICAVNVTFRPTAPGVRYGAAELLDGTGNPFATAYIHGTGLGPQVNFPAGVQTTIGSGFSLPYGVAVDGYGNVFVADQGLNAIKEMVAAGGYTTINTIAGGFNQPVGLAFDGAGNLFVADYVNNAVKEILAAGGYTTVNTLISGLDGPIGVAVDGNGNVYIANTLGHTVLELLAVNGSIPPSPTVVTLESGFQIYNVAVDASGNVFESVVADADSEIRELVAVNGTIPASPVVRILGSGFDNPTGLSVDGNGNLFVADDYNHAIKEIVAVNGVIPDSPTIKTLGSGFFYPQTVVADGRGNVYVADRRNGRVEMLNYADPPSLGFADTNVGSTSADSPQTVEVTNVGNADLMFQVPSIGNNPSISSGFTLDATTTCPQLNASSSSNGTLAAGASCTYAVDFIPAVTGANSGALVLTDTNLNAAGSMQSISLSGTGTGTQLTQTISFAPLPPSVQYGVTPLALSATGGGSGNPVVFSVQSGPGLITGNSLTITGVGTVVVAADQAGGSGYLAAPTVTQSIAVTPAVLIVAANNASQVYGTAPVLTATITGYVNGDNSSVVQGAPALGTAATSTSLPGTYPITIGIGTLAASNYTFFLVGGIDTVTFTASVPGPSGLCNGAYSGTYNGNLNATAGGACIFMNGAVAGNLHQSGGTVTLIGTTVTGNLQQSGGAVTLVGTTVGGNFQINGGGTFTVTGGSYIGGNLQIQNIPAGAATNMVCGSTVHGDLQFQNNGSAVLIGGAAPASCPGNMIGGNLVIQTNTGSIQVFNDAVGGNLQCQGNSLISGGGDTAKSKKQQCSAF